MSSVIFSSDGTPSSEIEGGQALPFQKLYTNGGHNPGKFNRSLQVNAHGGPQRLVVGGDTLTWREVEHLDGEKFQAATDLHSGDTGVAGSARGALMSPIAAADLRDDSLVTLPNGYQTTAAAAARLGYLSRNPAGGYTNTQQGAPAPQQAAQAQPQPAPMGTPTRRSKTTAAQPCSSTGSPPR